jgi:uncharacterized protein YabE (DUF348 family)
MIEKTRTKTFFLVRSSRKTQISVALLTVFIVAVSVLLFKANTIQVEVDGKEIQLTTLDSTVGGALKHSRLGIFPEDVVEPDRSTEVSKGLEVQITRSVPVRLTVDGQLYTNRTPAPTVGTAIEDLSNRLGLDLKGTDEVNWERGDPVIADMELDVHRSVPVQIKVDGKDIATEIAPRTVEETLNKLDIVLGDKDKVSLPLDQMIKANDQIQVVRVTEKIENVTSEIPYQIVAQPADFPVGLPDRPVNKGSNGMHEQVVRVSYEDGKEVNRLVLQQRVTRAPVNQVVSRGAQTTISRGGTTISFKRAYIMRATAYSGSGITATGKEVQWGVVAVDPRVIPLGTKLYIEGYGEGVALDTGGAIKGNRVDLYMDSEDSASSWGVRSVVVYVK